MTTTACDDQFAPEPDAAEALRVRITTELGWECAVPEYRDEIEL